MSMDDDEATVREHIRSRFDATFEEKVARALEVRHQTLVAHHHFTWASTECVYLYRDGYFFATTITTQAVNEGIIRFAAERNKLNKEKKRTELVDDLLNRQLISSKCAVAMRRIMNSYRNDVSHMNPSVAGIPIKDLAKRNLEDLALIEGELFECSFEQGKLRPKHRQYWDISAEGTITVSLRPG
jgi:hypothetical protein